MLSDTIQAALVQFKNIPEELKALPQWVLWRSEDIGATKPTKIPYSINGSKSSVTNPQHWAKFEEVCNIFASGSYTGIGFVFSSDDDYTFIDLDQTADPIILERQRKVFQEFNSYSEVSPSGEGLHIICKGTIAHGRRRSCIEVYSSERYATFTGQVYHNVSIRDCQQELNSLWEQLGNKPVQQFITQGDVDEKATDQEIIEQASNAVNGDKFRDLFAGRWQSLYPSQSEADLSLINIIAFYTKNRVQIGRLFRSSGLGQRDKAKRQDYLNWMMDKAFDKELPPIDMEGLRVNIDNAVTANRPVAQRLEPSAHNGLVAGSNPAGPTNKFKTHNNRKVLPSTKPPPGLVGEIAQFIYAAAPRPVPEIAIAASIGLMSGICGRAYNVSSTGVNQYILLLAKTGRGKEAIQSGISKLIYAVRQQVPTVEECIGPDEIASGPALYKYLSKHPSFVSILSEFGLRLQMLSDMNGNGANVSLRRMILQLYAKSGFSDMAHPSVYSDKDKNIAAIASPAFSILGESTPHTFYKNLHEEMITEGLLPRFLLIEYDGDRVPENPTHAEAKPSFELIDKLAAIAANAATVQNAQPRRAINVGFSDTAMKMSKEYSINCDAFINNRYNNEVVMELWNRAHLKVIKLAALVAIGVNMWTPVIEAEHMEWAIDLVDHDIETLSKKFEQGMIGANTQEVKQIDEVIKVIKSYHTSDWDSISKYCAAKDEGLHSNKVIPYGYLSKRLISLASFRTDKMGATFAIKRTLQTMIDRDYINEIPREQLRQKYGTIQKCYMVSNSSILKDGD